MFVDLPHTHAQVHGETQRQLVTLFPFAVDNQILASHESDVDTFAVDAHLCPTGPFGYAHIKRERGLALVNGESDVFVEGIVGHLANRDLFAVGHLHIGGAGTVDHGSYAVVGRGIDEVLAIIGPSLCMVVLAAAAAERVHGEERSAVIDTGVMVLRVALHHVGRRDVTQSFEVGHYRCRERVERHVFTVVCPCGIACKAQHYLVARHLLHHAATLDPLTRVDISHACVFVGTEHATRHLSEGSANETLHVVGGMQHLRVARQHIISGWFAKTLGNVYVVPVGQRCRVCPVGCVAVNLVGEVKEKLVARAVVEPQHRIEVVATTAVLPIVFKKLVVGNGHLPSEIVGHELQDPLVARMFIIGLERGEHDHLCPQLGLVAAHVDGSERPVFALALEDGLNPCLCLREHGLVVKDISEVAIALEPIGHLLPSVVAPFCEPCVVVLVEPCRDLAEMSRQAVALQLQVTAHPPCRAYAADRQLYEMLLPQGCPRVCVIVA